MKRIASSFLLAAVVLAPAVASANPTDLVQGFSGTAQASFSGPEWQPVPGTRHHFVTKLRFVELSLTFSMTGTCEGCETAVLIDGVPSEPVEGALDGDMFSAARRGHHWIQLAVRGTATVDGPWNLLLIQVP